MGSWCKHVTCGLERCRCRKRVGPRRALEHAATVVNSVARVMNSLSFLDVSHLCTCRGLSLFVFCLCSGPSSLLYVPKIGPLHRQSVHVAGPSGVRGATDEESCPHRCPKKDARTGARKTWSLASRQEADSKLFRHTRKVIRSPWGPCCYSVAASGLFLTCLVRFFPDQKVWVLCSLLPCP